MSGRLFSGAALLADVALSAWAQSPLALLRPLALFFLGGPVPVAAAAWTVQMGLAWDLFVAVPARDNSRYIVAMLLNGLVSWLYMSSPSGPGPGPGAQHTLTSVHAHPLSISARSHACHTCDLCRARVQVSHRCGPCDFDVCGPCLADRPTLPSSRPAGPWGHMRRALGLATEAEGGGLLLGAGLLAAACSAALGVSGPYWQARILEGGGGGDIEGAGRYRDVAGLAAAGLGAAVCGAVRHVCLYRVGTRTSHAARGRLFAALLDRPIAFFDRTMTAELAARMGSDAQAMASPIQQDLAIVLGAALGLVGSLAMCLALDWRLTLLCLSTLGPPALALRAYADWGAAVHGRVWSSLAGASGVAVQALAHIRTVRAAGPRAHAAEVRRYADATAEALRCWEQDSLAGGGAVVLTGAVDVFALALILWCTTARGWAVSYAFPMHWAAASAGFHTMMAYYSGFLRGAAAAQRIFACIDAAERPFLPPRAPPPGPGPGPVAAGWVLDGVRFRYNDNDGEEVLRGVSLHIRPHGTTALVGPSGGGKTTLINLLLRFYEPTGGQILADGVPYRDLQWPEERDRIAVVSQTPELFADTVWNNLVYGLAEEERTQSPANEARVHGACRRAQAHDFILALGPLGYATQVGERGVRLSGGQRQRLAIARAMLRRARLILLDEATSSLDAESEARVQAALDEMMFSGARAAETTVVVVAHRLSTVVRADQICVLDGGIIRESGTHASLLGDFPDGLYASLVRHQKLE